MNNHELLTLYYEKQSKLHAIQTRFIEDDSYYDKYKKDKAILEAELKDLLKQLDERCRAEGLVHWEFDDKYRYKV